MKNDDKKAELEVEIITVHRPECKSGTAPCENPEPRTGPAKVTTEAFRKGWDGIQWGDRKVGQA